MRNQDKDVKAKVKNIKMCNIKVQIHLYYDKKKT